MGSATGTPPTPSRFSACRSAPPRGWLRYTTADHWHHLATTYGNQAAASNEGLWQSAGIDKGPAPVWARLAEDFDAVHVSLARLMSGLYVPVSSTGVRTTTSWAWYFEGTWWMRSAFTAVQDLPPLLGPPEDERL